MFNLRTFSQVLATVIEIFLCSILNCLLILGTWNVKLNHKAPFLNLFIQTKKNQHAKQNKTVAKIHESL